MQHCTSIIPSFLGVDLSMLYLNTFSTYDQPDVVGGSRHKVAFPFALTSKNEIYVMKFTVVATHNNHI